MERGAHNRRRPCSSASWLSAAPRTCPWGSSSRCRRFAGCGRWRTPCRWDRCSATSSPSRTLPTPPRFSAARRRRRRRVSPVRRRPGTWPGWRRPPRRRSRPAQGRGSWRGARLPPRRRFPCKLLPREGHRATETSRGRRRWRSARSSPQPAIPSWAPSGGCGERTASSSPCPPPPPSLWRGRDVGMRVGLQNGSGGGGLYLRGRDCRWRTSRRGSRRRAAHRSGSRSRRTGGNWARSHGRWGTLRGLSPPTGRRTPASSGRAISPPRSSPRRIRPAPATPRLVPGSYLANLWFLRWVTFALRVEPSAKCRSFRVPCSSMRTTLELNLMVPLGSSFARASTSKLLLTQRISCCSLRWWRSTLSPAIADWRKDDEL